VKKYTFSKEKIPMKITVNDKTKATVELEKNKRWKKTEDIKTGIMEELSSLNLDSVKEMEEMLLLPPMALFL
jgi:uncharacterized protein YjiK